MNDRVRVDTDTGVAHVRLVRAERMNALDGPMFDALVNAGEQLRQAREVRCIVLSGEGRAFCSGLDKSLITKAGTTATPLGHALGPRTHGIANREQYAALVWRDVPAPVIAVVHGVAFGGGFQLALGADLRFVAADAQLSLMEIKWGLIPDMGGTALMRDLVRDDVARELMYTGRVFSGSEAVALGLATRVCAHPLDEALKTAREIATKSPDAMRAAKRLLNALPNRSVAAALLAESEEQDRLIAGPNHAEAVASNLAQRAPQYSDP
ncbi:MAG: crotonase/enoyl-CoA hydratase family protein [Steroidobacteraceae bacterium]